MTKLNPDWSSISKDSEIRELQQMLMKQHYRSHIYITLAFALGILAGVYL